MRRKTLAAAVAAVVAFAALAVSGPALALSGFIVTYYWDAGHTVVAGYAARDCTGYTYVYGTPTGYSDVQTWSC